MSNYNKNDILASDLTLKIKEDPKSAETIVVRYLNQIFTQHKFVKAKVNLDSKTALNSVSGICTLENEKKLFFKFHSEENETISLLDNEIYQSEVLSNLGWDVITPVATSNVPGKQCALYSLIDKPTAYDYLKELDFEYLNNKEYSNQKDINFLVVLDKSLTKQIQLALESLKICDFDLSSAAIHQLFSHRLVSVKSEEVRLKTFYSSYSSILSKKWVINNQSIPYTIEQIIDDSKKLLLASKSNGMSSVISHGDEHFANQFIYEDNLVLFDPAFAGRMPALLAFIKATTHNSIAHPFWLYEPELTKNNLNFAVSETNSTIYLEHNWDLKKVAPIRAQIQQMYIQKIWLPLLERLEQLNVLPGDWARYITCATFCSPFLAKNLMDPSQYPEKLGLFNLGFMLTESLKFTQGLTEVRGK